MLAVCTTCSDNWFTLRILYKTLRAVCTTCCGEMGALPALTATQAPAPVAGSTMNSSSWSMYSTPSGAPP